jgi:hypothetical protein
MVLCALHNSPEAEQLSPTTPPSFFHAGLFKKVIGHANEEARLPKVQYPTSH